MENFKKRVKNINDLSVCYIPNYNDLPILIYIEGDKIGYVNTFGHYDHGNMKEYFIQNGATSFARAFIPSNCTICYNCGFVKSLCEINDMDTMCDDCNDEFQAEMEEYYKDDITVDDCYRV
jgi:hypothetical protein